MSVSTPKTPGSSDSGRRPEPGISRDITWDRPLFLPPFLPNPRVIFDPLPFVSQRLPGAPRHHPGR